MKARYKEQNMWSHPKAALLFLLLLLTAARVALGQGREQAQNEDEKDQRASSAQARRVNARVNAKEADRQSKPVEPQSLALGEGLAILGAALDSRHQVGLPSDCSHFVHELYERAGFPYEYASSSELYAGIGEFRRVTSPQPGDLAVWRGHAGIVVNPAQHSFFSLLRSGRGVDSYDSPYWKQRGRPRFFRYARISPGGPLSNSIQTVSWKPTALRNTQPHQPADDPMPDASEEPANEIGSSAKLAERLPASAEFSRVVVVDSVRPKPDEVSTAFLQACNHSAESLRGHDLFQMASSVVVFDHFEVKKVHLARNQDWIEVQIDELASLTGGKAELHQRSERQRWPLSRRDNRSWDLTPSRDVVYLPQNLATRILANQLAQLTEDSPDGASRTQEKASLARLLDLLLKK